MEEPEKVGISCKFTTRWFIALGSFLFPRTQNASSRFVSQVEGSNFCENTPDV